MKIDVSSLGNPRSSRTWSGTPANLCRAFEAAGVLGQTIDTECYLPQWLRMVVKVFSKIFYGGSRYVRLGLVERRLRADYLQAQLGSNEPSHILHFCTHDLPRKQTKPGQQHYLFIDGTWHLWRKYATDAPAISQRLSRDIERLDRSSYHEVDHIFTISEYVRKDLVTHYAVSPEKITVVGTGRGAIQPYYGEKDYASGHILFVAKERFTDKGGERLLAGFALAKKENPSLKLVIVGQENYRVLVGNQPGVTVHGHLPLDELQALYNTASLFAMPAINEPWGLVFLEALSCRVPLLGLNRLGFPEISGDGRFGFSLENGGTKEIAGTLRQAFADPERLAQMGTAGQAYCLANFTWERTARIINDIIQRQAGRLST